MVEEVDLTLTVEEAVELEAYAHHMAQHRAEELLLKQHHPLLQELYLLLQWVLVELVELVRIIAQETMETIAQYLELDLQQLPL